MAIVGIAYPFQKGPQSFPAQKTEADVVEDNVLRVLQTRKGERPMRPATGSNIWDFVFENVGDLLNARVDAEVRRSLAEGEPRARVLAVGVAEVVRPDGAKNMVVTVAWQFNREVRQTAASFVSPGSGG